MVPRLKMAHEPKLGDRNMRTFNNPEEFMLWLGAQNVNVQKGVSRIILALADMGIPANCACHLAYDMAQHAAEVHGMALVEGNGTIN
jgi:hypothetical protein